MSNIPKVIWSFWEQGWDSAPPIALKSVESWRKSQPDWEIRLLDKSNLHEYIPLEQELPNFWEKKPIQGRSDLIRINLLLKYGGVWIDSSLFLTKPFEQWLIPRIRNGFYAFSRPGPDRMLTSGFLAATPNNYLCERWRDASHQYWQDKSFATDYFWFHYCFEHLYSEDEKFRAIWDEVESISSDTIHLLVHRLIAKGNYTKLPFFKDTGPIFGKAFGPWRFESFARFLKRLGFFKKRNDPAQQISNKLVYYMRRLGIAERVVWSSRIPSDIQLRVENREDPIYKLDYYAKHQEIESGGVMHKLYARLTS